MQYTLHVIYYNQFEGRTAQEGAPVGGGLEEGTSEMTNSGSNLETTEGVVFAKWASSFRLTNVSLDRSHGSL